MFKKLSLILVLFVSLNAFAVKKNLQKDQAADQPSEDTDKIDPAEEVGPRVRATIRNRVYELGKGKNVQELSDQINEFTQNYIENRRLLNAQHASRQVERRKLMKELAQLRNLQGSVRLQDKAELDPQIKEIENRIKTLGNKTSKQDQTNSIPFERQLAQSSESHPVPTEEPSDSFPPLDEPQAPFTHTGPESGSEGFPSLPGSYPVASDAFILSSVNQPPKNKDKKTSKEKPYGKMIRKEALIRKKVYELNQGKEKTLQEIKNQINEFKDNYSKNKRHLLSQQNRGWLKKKEDSRRLTSEIAELRESQNSATGEAKEELEIKIKETEQQLEKLLQRQPPKATHVPIPFETQLKKTRGCNQNSAVPASTVALAEDVTSAMHYRQGSETDSAPAPNKKVKTDPQRDGEAPTIEPRFDLEAFPYESFRDLLNTDLSFPTEDNAEAFGLTHDLDPTGIAKRSPVHFELNANVIPPSSSALYFYIGELGDEFDIPSPKVPQ